MFCGSAARDSQQATLIAAGKLFNQAGKSFKVLADEPSSGWALYQLGDFEGAKQLSVLLAEKIRPSKVSTVVALDADSYRMLMGRTTRFGGDIKGIKILHVNAVMAGWLKDNQISVAERYPMRQPIMIPAFWPVFLRMLNHRAISFHKFWRMILKRWPPIKSWQIAAEQGACWRFTEQMYRRCGRNANR